MESRATAKYVRISPRKVRQVLPLIKGKGVLEALAILRFSPKKAAKVVQGVLRSAVSNAKQKDVNVRDEDLFVKALFSDQGPAFKRIRPRAMGRANRILKRTSHITVIVDTLKGD
jgi:large subunit ribosomal protein L22